MIGSNIFITNKFTYGSIDPAFKSVLQYANDNNITAPLPGTIVYKALDTMVKSYKAEEVWDEWDTYFQFMYNTPTVTRNFFEFSKIDWKRLTTGSYEGGLTFELGGIKGGGNPNGYFNTKFNPFLQGVKYTLDNASRYAYLYNVSGSSIDGIGGNNSNRLSANAVSQNINNGSSGGPVTILTSQGMKSIHRLSSNQIEVYQNEAQTITGNATSTKIEDNIQFVLRAAGAYGAHTVGMYAMGASLVDKNTKIVNIFNQYTASIGL